jgi:hypothetical protein
MKRKSEQAEASPIAVGDEVLIDRGRIIYAVESIEGNVAAVVQKSNIVGALAYAPQLKGGHGPAKVTRKVDVYRLNKLED